jgi:hypothetical protein
MSVASEPRLAILREGGGEERGPLAINGTSPLERLIRST